MSVHQSVRSGRWIGSLVRKRCGDLTPDQALIDPERWIVRIQWNVRYGPDIHSSGLVP
ncbi:hypothetical protein [Maricaulis sp.]|uniref:hypothetical protein n=1 Tax=Maricaulis sp. TaxID=1486257 RepID=UPI003A92C55F